MKSIIKILLLVSFILGAVVSVFVFSGSRIMEGVDVSHIKIKNIVYMDDIKQRVDGIGEEWLDEFNKIDHLISVYYGNSILSSDDEEIAKTLLVDKSADRMTTYAFNDYFMRRSWDEAEIKGLKRNAIKLSSYKSANGDKVAKGGTRSKLEIVTKTCQHYLDAKGLSLRYTTNDDAKRQIESARTCRSDSYLMNDTLINRKLKNAEKKLMTSHLQKIADSIMAFDAYSTDYNICDMTNVEIARRKVLSIEAIIRDYNNANFYNPKEKKQLEGMIVDLNYIIKDWNKEIEAEVEVTYYNDAGELQTRMVRKYPEKNKIKEIKIEEI